MLRTFQRSFVSSAARSNFARGTVVGRVGNVEFNETENGQQYCRYSVAVNHRNKEGGVETDWMRIYAYGETQCRIAEKVVVVGNKLLVDFGIRVQRNEDKTYHNYTQRAVDVLSWAPKKDDVEGTEPRE